MIFDVLTIFPEIVENYLGGSIMKCAAAAGAVDFRVRNIRDYATDRHQVTDDIPFGGGPGMVMKPEPLAEAIERHGLFIELHTDRAQRARSAPAGTAAGRRRRRAATLSIRPRPAGGSPRAGSPPRRPLGLRACGTGSIALRSMVGRALKVDRCGNGPGPGAAGAEGGCPPGRMGSRRSGGLPQVSAGEQP